MKVLTIYMDDKSHAKFEKWCKKGGGAKSKVGKDLSMGLMG